MRELVSLRKMDDVPEDGIFCYPLASIHTYPQVHRCRHTHTFKRKLALKPELQRTKNAFAL